MTTAREFYFRQDIVAEPRVDAWYAWTHLIAPATCARNLTERHLKMMDSYIGSPESHQAAVANPALVGGPFMDFECNRVEDVKELRHRTLTQRTQLIELSNGIEQLDRLLRERAEGYNLETLYMFVPNCLKGYVELVYDLNNHPSFRLIEPLLYKSIFYDISMQRVSLSKITGDNRPFVLSTPRLDMGNTVQLHVPFGDERYEKLFRMKYEPSSIGAIRDTKETPAVLFRSSRGKSHARMPDMKEPEPVGAILDMLAFC
jgi:hypothetical protein